MKKFGFGLLMVCALMSVTSGFAASPTVVAEMKTAGMFSPRPGGIKFGIQILSDGQVIVFNSDSSRPIAKLAKSKQAELLKAIEFVKPSDLILENPNEPECMDAPTTTIRITQKNGTEIKLAQRSGCRDSFLKNKEGGNIIEVLKGLNKLEDLNIFPGRN